MQSVLRAIYPSECLICRDFTDADFALCGPCWRDTPFVGGLVCDACGTPLPGPDDDEVVHCDDCMRTPRPWSRGRAALAYGETGRRIVLGLKHGDRTDLVRPAAAWMAQAAAPLVSDDTILVPVPLHWTRLWRRRYNQSAMLAARIATLLDRDTCPDALVRARRTTSLSGTVAARFAAMDGAIRPHPRRGAAMSGRNVILVDDVMTSGATLSACAGAARDAGARDVAVLLLARAVRDD